MNEYFATIEHEVRKFDAHVIALLPLFHLTSSVHAIRKGPRAVGKRRQLTGNISRLTAAADSWSVC